MEPLQPQLDFGGRKIFRVAELAAGIKEVLEQEVGRVWVAGEISDLFRARSGHCYFTLKDDGAQLRSVLFRGNLARIPFDPEDGLEVACRWATFPGFDFEVSVEGFEVFFLLFGGCRGFHGREGALGLFDVVECG